MTNLPTIYRRFVGIYRSATSRCPAVRPNRPGIVRHSAPIVRCAPAQNSTDNRPIIQHNRPITQPNPRIIYRRFSGNYRSGRNPLALADCGRPAAPARTMANNLSPSYHQTVGIYHLFAVRPCPSGAAIRGPARRPISPRPRRSSTIAAITDATRNWPMPNGPYLGSSL